jgi:hypothetical protein
MKPSNELLKYAGMATQFLVTLAIAMFLGYKADQWLQWNFPLFIVLLPVLLLFALIYKIYRDISK